MPDEPKKRARLMPPIVLLVFAIGFVAVAAWQRMGQQQASQPQDQAGPATVAPQRVAFADALASETDAFHTTCSLCHEPPNPQLYDGVGWEGIGRKMKERMAERMDVAVLHLMHSARPTIKFPPLAAISGPASASQPTGRNAQ